MGEAITVVVPVRNRPQLITRTLASIKAQTWRPLRVIVVDNASTDNTPATVTEWIKANVNDADPDFSCVLVEEPVTGPSNARNRGLQEVETRLMMHFDSDDLMAPGHIEGIMRRFENPDYPDLVCFRIRYHGIHGKTITTHKPGGDMMPTHLVHSLIRTQGYACETALARRAGGWNENLQCWEDLEFGVRLLLEARKRVFIHDVNVDVLAREDSVTGVDFSSKQGQWEKALDAMEEDLRKGVNRNRDRWIRYVAYRRVILAAHYLREGLKKESHLLLHKALSLPELTKLQRLYLKLAYRYTALGGHGASIPAKFLF